MLEVRNSQNPAPLDDNRALRFRFRSLGSEDIFHGADDSNKMARHTITFATTLDGSAGEK